MSEQTDTSLLPRALKFRLHLYLYAAIFVLTVLLNTGFGASLPMFWPLAVWGLAVTVHFFIASSIDVPEEWIEERAEDLRGRSYDFDHIRNIQKRVEKRDKTVTHHLERDE
ncbi:MAG: 2TM domain-containing protein [Alphaproteobacteria bacterium]|jgi:fatty acid desaturase